MDIVNSFYNIQNFLCIFTFDKFIDVIIGDVNFVSFLRKLLVKQKKA